MSTPRLITPGDAARALNVSTKTVLRLVASGKLPVLRINARVLRIAENDLAAYVAHLSAVVLK